MLPGGPNSQTAVDNTLILEPTKPLLPAIRESNNSFSNNHSISCTESVSLIICPCFYLCQPTKFSQDCCNCCALSDGIEIQPLIEIAGTWTSPNNPIPKWFICFRIFLTLCMISILAFNFAIYAIYDNIKFWFFYFTQWTNFLAMILMIIKCISTPTIYNIIRINPNQLINAQKKIWRLYVIHNILLQTVIPSITLVVVNYWLFVHDPEYDDPETSTETTSEERNITFYSSIGVHGVSGLIVWIDFIISTEKMYYKSCIWSILFGTLFTIWTGVFAVLGLENHNGEKYIYEVFDWSQGYENPILFYFLSMGILIFVSIIAAFFKNLRLSTAGMISPVMLLKTNGNGSGMELSTSMLSSDNKVKYTDTVPTMSGQGTM